MSSANDIELAWFEYDETATLLRNLRRIDHGTALRTWPPSWQRPSGSTLDAIVHPMSGIRPSYYGIFEDNDPAKRLMVIANYDNDVPEYWEWSGDGVYPFDASNEAYKLGVNYIIYGLTH